MADYKFTSEELKRCIECCIKAETWCDCEEMGCPASYKHGCRFYLRTDDDYENTIYIEILKDVLDLLNHKKSEWVSVDERLPEENEIYCVIVANRKSHKYKKRTHARYKNGIWLDLYDNWENKCWVVTHWMPLPEAPKGKDGE